MKLTEEDAKTKWCAYARPGAVQPSDCGEVRGNRNMDGTVDRGSLCIASACMAWRTAYEWRWSDEPDSIWVQGRAPHETATEERVVGGFCGLAGQPQ